MTTRLLGHPVRAREGAGALGADVQNLARICSNCGQEWAAWACGPTHAVNRNLLGIEWDGVTPGLAAHDKEVSHD